MAECAAVMAGDPRRPARAEFMSNELDSRAIMRAPGSANRRKPASTGSLMDARLWISMYRRVGDDVRAPDKDVNEGPS